MINIEEDEIISNLDEDTICFTRPECAALVEECKNSYIGKDNLLAKNVIRKMIDFLGYTEIHSK